MKVEHIGIAVQSLEEADRLFSILFKKTPYKHESVESEAVKTSFYQMGETKVELLEATADTSAIARYVENKGTGMHHIAFEVEDIREEMERLKKEGIRLLNDEPKRGADQKMICFLHPKDCGGVLVELCQTIQEA
ncbi:MAG: methylmalonyl-CoA epimerase [Bacteroidia bacterium]